QQIPGLGGVLDHKTVSYAVSLGRDDAPTPGWIGRVAVARPGCKFCYRHPPRYMSVGIPGVVGDLPECVHGQRGRPIWPVPSEGVIKEVVNVADLPRLDLRHIDRLGIFEQRVVVVELPGLAHRRERRQRSEKYRGCSQ